MQWYMICLQIDQNCRQLSHLAEIFYSSIPGFLQAWYSTWELRCTALGFLATTLTQDNPPSHTMSTFTFFTFPSWEQYFTEMSPTIIIFSCFFTVLTICLSWCHLPCNVNCSFIWMVFLFILYCFFRCSILCFCFNLCIHFVFKTELILRFTLII